MRPIDTIAIIGFGEVGQIFARALKTLGVSQINVYDIAFARSDSAPSKALAGSVVERCATAAAAARTASLIISAVTAEQTLAAAQSVVKGIEPGAFYLDLNSASPGVKRETSVLIDKAGGRYVEAAVMTAVPPHGLRAPMLLGGPHAAAFLTFAAGLDLKARVYADTVGSASAVKMSRSVMIKGMEALITECLLTARHYGVERDVMASLGETLPVPDWEVFARYMISRSLQHGRRRAEEMREVAKTVAEAGVDPLMSTPIADRQQATFDLARNEGIDPKGLLPDLLDAMLRAGRAPGEGERIDEEVSGSAA